MPVYDKSGNLLQTVYSKDGQLLSVAYSKDGTQIFPDGSATFKVMTYNVQMFHGINAQTAMQTAIINKYKPDLIGMQELSTYTVTTLPAAGQAMLADYPVKQLSNHKNKLMLATKGYQLSNVVIADFANQDPGDMEQYNETRAYIKADVQIGGKNVTLINTHLAVFSAEVRALQMQEIFAMAQQCESCIITGDFNSTAESVESEAYIQIYKPFVDAGYNLANNSPSSGFHNTFTSSSTATSLADLTAAIDTIIVSSDMNIVSVVFDDTKFDYLNGSAIDHIPVVATLQMN